MYKTQAVKGHGTLTTAHWNNTQQKAQLPRRAQRIHCA